MIFLLMDKSLYCVIVCMNKYTKNLNFLEQKISITLNISKFFFGFLIIIIIIIIIAITITHLLLITLLVIFFISIAIVKLIIYFSSFFFFYLCHTFLRKLENEKNISFLNIFLNGFNLPMLWIFQLISSHEEHTFSFWLRYIRYVLVINDEFSYN